MASSTQVQYGMLLGAAITGGIAGILYWSARSQLNTATTLASLRVERITDIARRAETNGGDAGLVAVRGAAAALNDPIRAQDVGDCVAMSTDKYLVTNAINEKGTGITEKKHYVATEANIPPFLLLDGFSDSSTAARSALVRAAHQSQLPLTPAPTLFERMTDSPSISLKLSRDGIAVSVDERKERIIGLESVRACLQVGTVLTIVAHAATDPRGNIVLTAGANSPFIISRDTLAQLVEAHTASSGWLRVAGVICIAASGTMVVAWLVQNWSLLLGGSSGSAAERLAHDRRADETPNTKPS